MAGFNPQNSISLKYTLFSRFSILCEAAKEKRIRLDSIRKNSSNSPVNDEWEDGRVKMGIATDMSGNPIEHKAGNFRKFENFGDFDNYGSFDSLNDFGDFENGPVKLESVHKVKVVQPMMMNPDQLLKTTTVHPENIVSERVIAENVIESSNLSILKPRLIIDMPPVTAVYQELVSDSDSLSSKRGRDRQPKIKSFKNKVQSQIKHKKHEKQTVQLTQNKQQTVQNKAHQNSKQQQNNSICTGWFS